MPAAPAKYQIRLPLPPSVNAAYQPSRNGGIMRTTDYTDWLTLAARHWRGQFSGAIPLILGRIRIQRIYVFKDERIRDISNYSKVLDDYLQGKFYKDDEQIDEEQSFKRIVRGAASNKVFVFVEEISDQRFMDMLHPEYHPSYAL